MSLLGHLWKFPAKYFLQKFRLQLLRFGIFMWKVDSCFGSSWACLVGCVIAEGMRGGMEGPGYVMSLAAVTVAATFGVSVLFRAV